MPYNPNEKTHFRVDTRNGELVYLDIPYYYMRPNDAEGALVSVDWGNDIEKYTYDATGEKLRTVMYCNYNFDIGARDISVENQNIVFISIIVN